MLVLAVGMGFIFVPLTTVAVSKVANTDAGLASALLNVGPAGRRRDRPVRAGHGRGDGRRATPARPRSASCRPRSQAGQIPIGSCSTSARCAGDAVRRAGRRLPRCTTTAAVHAVAQVQAHASSMGFLAATIFGAVSIVVALVMINVKKSDLPTAGHRAPSRGSLHDDRGHRPLWTVPLYRGCRARDRGAAHRIVQRAGSGRVRARRGDASGRRVSTR